MCGNAIVDPDEQCDDGNAANGEGCDNNCVITAIMYIKASNTSGNDVFGHIALSAGGSTLAVAASGEDSAATGTVLWCRRHRHRDLRHEPRPTVWISS